MKVLWFSNCVLSQEQSQGSGSWLFAMRDLISSEVELINVTETSTSRVISHQGNGIREYLLPQWKCCAGVPSRANIQIIDSIITKERPDVIHIWGTEKYWALLFSRGYLKANCVLLEIQGVLSACVDVFYGGLAPIECKQMHSFKSLLKPNSSLCSSFIDYKNKAELEIEIVSHFRFIATQSNWTRDQLRFICPPGAEFFNSLRPVRQSFIEATKWVPTGNKEPRIFCSYSYCVPFKGLHFLLKAIWVLSKRYSGVQLVFAGPDFIHKPFYRVSDYECLLRKLIKKFDIRGNIHFCGRLDANQIVDEIRKADVVVNPSLVESYSAAAAEALILGAPTVLAYSGAMPGFSYDKDVALYYNPLDYRSLASHIEVLFSDIILRDKLRDNSISVMNSFVDNVVVKQRQIETYRRIVDRSNTL